VDHKNNTIIEFLKLKWKNKLQEVVSLSRFELLWCHLRVNKSADHKKLKSSFCFLKLQMESPS